MWVCSRLTRAGTTPATARASNAAAKCGVQPRSSSVTAMTSREGGCPLSCSACAPALPGTTVSCLAPSPAAPGRPGLQLQPAAQDLGHAPGLRDAAARQERRVGVEHFADLPDARLVEMTFE